MGFIDIISFNPHSKLQGSYYCSLFTEKNLRLSNLYKAIQL